MNRTEKIISALLTTLLLSGCTPDPLDVGNVPTLAPHIVVSSQVVPGQSIAVLLTRSISALEAGSSTNADTLLNSIVINDAVVTLSWQDQTDTLRFLGTGVYGSVTTPLINDEIYSLSVTAPSLGTVTSKTSMKKEIKFDSVQVSLEVTGKDTLASVSYQFTDPPGDNWYMLNVQRLRNPEVNLIDNLNPRIFIKALTDVDFQGQIKSETFTVPFRRFHEGDTVAVILANISEEYFNYIKTRIDGQSSISEFVAEPLNFPGNVVGGYGYFNMQIPDVRVFRLE